MPAVTCFQDSSIILAGVNALSPIIPETDADIWKSATHSVNEWRGRCLHHFTRCESAVSETLMVISGIPDLGSNVRLRHLIGQKYEDLGKAIGEGGPFAEKGSKAAARLEEFKAFDDLRRHLAHGVATITLERNGDWIVIFRCLALRNRQAERETKVYEQREADQITDRLGIATQKLCDELRNFTRLI